MFTPHGLIIKTENTLETVILMLLFILAILVIIILTSNPNLVIHNLNLNINIEIGPTIVYLLLLFPSFLFILNKYK